MSGTGKTLKNVSFTGNQLIDGLIDGRAWAGTITYAFPTKATDYSYTWESGQNFGAISLSQRNAALFAMEQSYGNAANDGFSVEGFTNTTFQLGAATNATIRFAQSDAANPTAYAYMQGNYAQAGDIWFGTNYDYTRPSPGNYAWHTLIHELGHALGLKHGHETDGAGALPADHDSLEYSVMTYRTYVGAGLGGYTYEQWGAPQTFMMSDIAALQEMYGADFTTNAGRTVYSWKPTTGATVVNGANAILPGGNKIFATIWDGGGIDTYNLSAYATDLRIDLRPGESSTFSSSQKAYLGAGHTAEGNIFNALQYRNDARSLIENATGGTGNDSLTGNAAANVLAGNAGHDRLAGLGGNDTLTGHAGNDVFVFAAGGGRDVINDFVNGSDRIDLSATALTDFNAVLASLTSTTAGAVITTEIGSTITLKGVLVAALDAGDFIFA